MYSVLNTLSEYAHFYILKKHYFTHFCCLFLKFLKAFSVYLKKENTNILVREDTLTSWIYFFDDLTAVNYFLLQVFKFLEWIKD